MIRALLAALEAVLFCIITIPVIIILFIVRKINRPLADKISRGFIVFIFTLIRLTLTTRVHVDGQENIPEEKSVLYIGNHLSIFDIVMTYPLFKGVTGFVAKKELKKIPLLNFWMDLIECEFLDRSSLKAGLKMITNSIDKVNDGISMCIFPEGTRSKTGEIGEFKGGSFKIATRTKCPIVPVSIQNTQNILRTHIPFVKTTDVYITFGKPIYPDELSREEIKRLDTDVKETIISLRK
ncbi:MAG: 1-acyl-sn-glycerol-3-phosphate acyltransferase [Lachnospiraceae bacterium]|nr:1-acyl-sn-glycerol-3-phosphate acyltransferase [Lachnospiraceae bacterium]